MKSFTFTLLLLILIFSVMEADKISFKRSRFIIIKDKDYYDDYPAIRDLSIETTTTPVKLNEKKNEKKSFGDFFDFLVDLPFHEDNVDLIRPNGY